MIHLMAEDGFAKNVPDSPLCSTLVVCDALMPTSHTPSPFTLVPLTPGDAAAVSHLEERCFPTFWSAEQYAKELQTPYLDGWGAFVEQDDRKVLAGYIVCSHVADMWEIVNIAVDPAWRCKGIASRLLETALQDARKKHSISCSLEVRRGNRPARALYARAGFVQAGIRKNYYAETGEDALVLVLDLSASPTL